MKVTVVYALPRKALTLPLDLPEGATAGDAMGALVNHASLRGTTDLTVGIHGHSVGLDELLHAGDRVEIYRSLSANPIKSRRSQLIRKSSQD